VHNVAQLTGASDYLTEVSPFFQGNISQVGTKFVSRF